MHGRALPRRDKVGQGDSGCRCLSFFNGVVGRGARRSPVLPRATSRQVIALARASSQPKGVAWTTSTEKARTARGNTLHAPPFPLQMEPLRTGTTPTTLAGSATRAKHLQTTPQKSSWIELVHTPGAVASIGEEGNAWAV